MPFGTTGTGSDNSPPYQNFTPQPHAPNSVPKKAWQMVKSWFAPADPNHNNNPHRGSGGIQTPWGFAPHTVLGQQLASDNRYNLDWQHEYSVRRPFDPGMGYYAYDSFGLVERTAIGAGVANRKRFNITTPAYYMPIKTALVTGLPHDAGMIDLQSLQIDNPDLQGYIG